MCILFLCIIFAALVVFNSIHDEAIFNPAQLFTVMWGSQILLALFMFDFYDWNYTGLIWIAVACCVFSLAFFVMGYTDKKNIGQVKSFPIADRAVYVLRLTGILAGGYILYVLYLNHISLDMFFSPQKILKIGWNMVVLRYAGKEITTTLSQVLLIFLYAFPLLSGYFCVYICKWKYNLAALLLLLLSTFIMSAKAILLTGILFWVAGYLTGFIEKNKRIPYKYLVWGFLSMLLLVMVLFGFMIVRSGSSNAATVAYASSRFSSYALGQVVAFDYWFPSFSWAGWNGGIYTFYGIFNALGVVKRKIGVFTTHIYIGSLSTNVYTVFRNLIEDFSCVGALIVISVAGIILGAAFRRILSAGRPQPLAAMLCIMGYGVIFWSFCTSLFAYASYICCFIYCYICLKYVVRE